MLTHQDLKPGSQGMGATPKSASESGEQNISGNPGIPRSESMIRINPSSPSKIISASNNIGGNGEQAVFFSTNSGASWGQTQLALRSGDAFQSDPTVEWTSDGTAWTTTIGVNASVTVLQMRSYKSTDNGATWTFDATFSTGNNNDKQMQWADHSAASPFKDNIYVIWHNGGPALLNPPTGPSGSWGSPLQISGGATTGTRHGGEINHDTPRAVSAL